LSRDDSLSISNSPTRSCGDSERNLSNYDVRNRCVKETGPQLRVKEVLKKVKLLGSQDMRKLAGNWLPVSQTERTNKQKIRYLLSSSGKPSGRKLGLAQGRTDAVFFNL